VVCSSQVRNSTAALQFLQNEHLTQMLHKCLRTGKQLLAVNSEEACQGHSRASGLLSFPLLILDLGVDYPPLSRRMCWGMSRMGWTLPNRRFSRDLRRADREVLKLARTA
jgi:hypothetical protein